MKTITIQEKEPQTIDYIDVIELGFERGEMDDSVFRDQYGYDDFWVEMQLNEHISLEWDKHTRTCEMNIHDNKQYIIDRYKIDNLITLKLVIEMFKIK